MIRKTLKQWNRFFFEPVSPASLGVFRIVFGLVILDSLIGKFIDRGLLYGAHGLVGVQSLATIFPTSESTFNVFHLIPGSDPALALFFVGLMAATLALILGFRTRLSSIVVFVGLLALSNRNPLTENAGDDLIRLNCFFLMFAPAGAAYSLDRWRALKKGLVCPTLIEPWALRLLQLQLAYVYLDTVYLKLHGEAWLDGTALYYALNYLELKRFDLSWLFHFLWQIKLATWGALAIETSMFSLVWSRRFRYGCLSAALALHLLLNVIMQFPVFQYAMIASLSVFIYPEDVEAAFSAITRRSQRSHCSRVRPAS